MTQSEKVNYILLAGLAALFAVIVFQKCSNDKALTELSTQVARYQDTVITHRVVDGDVVNYSKGAELTLDQYKAIDAARYASFERMLRNNNSQMLATVSLIISRPPITGNAPVTINADKSMVIDLTDSCSLIGNVTVDSTGKATKNIEHRRDSLDILIASDREKFWKGKKITATSVIRNNCGTITGQKAVVVVPAKKKVPQTATFKAVVTVAVFEAVKFLLTGKL